MSRILVATCENLIEPEGRHCIGFVRYRRGESDAACDTCGGRCGIAVAEWSHVEDDEGMS